MRVGIYNRWLATMGGGEKLNLTIAEYLSRAHDVSVISHAPVSKDLISRTLNLDLSAVQFLSVPEQPAHELGALTETYDLFINASHMDFVPSRARCAVMLVYFPAPITLDRAAQFRFDVGVWLKRALMVPSITDGVFGAELSNGTPLRRTTQFVRIELAASRARYAVKFDLSSLDASTTQARLALDGCVVAVVDLPRDGCFVPCMVTVPASEDKRARVMTIEANTPKDAGKNRFRMALTNFHLAHPRYALYQLLFERAFKQWGLRLHGVIVGRPSLTQILDTYDEIWAISDFTRKWIQQYWKRNSVILNPYVRVEDFAPAPKRNQILSVGRFFAGSHNKKHVEMIDAFRGMVDQGLTGWELHLAGGAPPDAIHREYVERVTTRAQGYPIFLHPDAPFEALKQLYGESAIYWHASGYGEDEVREPIKFEHFGITTLEAMASGCVPVVIGKGGQPEIVQHGRNGYCWHTLSELQSLTLRVMRDEALRQTLASAAVRDSHNFDKAHFQQRLQTHLSHLGL